MNTQTVPVKFYFLFLHFQKKIALNIFYYAMTAYNGEEVIKNWNCECCSKISELNGKLEDIILLNNNKWELAG